MHFGSSFEIQLFNNGAVLSLTWSPVFHTVWTASEYGKGFSLPFQTSLGTPKILVLLTRNDLGSLDYFPCLVTLLNSMQVHSPTHMCIKDRVGKWTRDSENYHLESMYKLLLSVSEGPVILI